MKILEIISKETTGELSDMIYFQYQQWEQNILRQQFQGYGHLLFSKDNRYAYLFVDGDYESRNVANYMQTLALTSFCHCGRYPVRIVDGIGMCSDHSNPDLNTFERDWNSRKSIFNRRKIIVELVGGACSACKIELQPGEEIIGFLHKSPLHCWYRFQQDEQEV